MNINVARRSPTCCPAFSSDQLIVSGVSILLSSGKLDLYVDWLLNSFYKTCAKLNIVPFSSGLALPSQPQETNLGRIV